MLSVCPPVRERPIEPRLTVETFFCEDNVQYQTGCHRVVGLTIPSEAGASRDSPPLARICSGFPPSYPLPISPIICTVVVMSDIKNIIIIGGTSHDAEAQTLLSPSDEGRVADAHIASTAGGNLVNELVPTLPGTHRILLVDALDFAFWPIASLRAACVPGELLPTMLSRTPLLYGGLAGVTGPNHFASQVIVPNPSADQEL